MAIGVVDRGVGSVCRDDCGDGVSDGDDDARFSCPRLSRSSRRRML